MKRILLIIMVAIVSNAYSQKDIYYIKTTGDTVFCKDIDMYPVKNLSDTKYKLDIIPLSGSKQTIELNDVSKIQCYLPVDNVRKAVSKKNNVRIQFEVHSLKEVSKKNHIPLRVVAEENNKKLFEYLYEQSTGQAGSKVMYRFFFNDGKEIFELDKKNYNESLKSIFSKCDVAMKKLNDGKKPLLYLRRIDELITDYYKCTNKKFIPQK